MPSCSVRWISIWIFREDIHSPSRICTEKTKTVYNYMNPELVSVILPAFNSSQLIADAIDSALSQTYADIEVIVVDDGSTDDTAEIAKSYGDRIRYIHQENAGPSTARNNGIKNARGEFVAFLDSDDTWFPEKISRQVELFEARPELGVVFTDARVSYHGNQTDRTWVQIMSSYDTLVSMNGELPTPWKLILNENFIPTCMAMVRRDCFDRYGMFDETLRFGEDWDLWLKFALHCDFYFISEPLGSITRNKDLRLYDWDAYFNSFIRLLERFDLDNPKLLASNGIDLSGKLEAIFFELGYHHYGRGRFAKARAAFLGGMKSRFTLRGLGYYLACIIDSSGVVSLREIKRGILK